MGTSLWKKKVMDTETRFAREAMEYFGDTVYQDDAIFAAW